MYLSALEVIGFKSFAKRTRLAFEPGITCIVGPNGSGKSAAADGIRWVLGEQSLKSIRAKRSEDVIFSGSRSRARLGLAEVSLTLADAESVGLDLAEVVITRRIDRGGNSEYLVNGRPVRLLDLAELLAKAGFAQKSYTVIPQGMIDAFVTASPQERRQMFEDATGVTPLLLKQQSTERKLEATRAQILRAKDLLHELEPRLRSLKRHAARARNRADVEAHLRSAEEQYAAQRWEGLQALLRSSLERIAAVDQRIAASNEALARFQAPGQTALAGTERLPALRKRLAQLRADERALLLALTRVEAMGDGDVDRVAEELTARQKEREKLTHELGDVRRELAAAAAEREAAAGDLADLQRLLASPADAAGAPADLLGDLAAARERAVQLATNLRTVRADDLPALVAEAGGLAELLDELVVRARRLGGARAAHALGDAAARLQHIAQRERAAERRLGAFQVREAEVRERLRAVEERIGILQRQREAAPPGTADRPAAEIRAQLSDAQHALAATEAEANRLEDLLLRAHTDEAKTRDDEQRLRGAVHAAEQEKAAFAAEAAAASARRDDLRSEAAERLGAEFAARLQRGAVTMSAPWDQGELRTRIERFRKQLLDIGGIDATVLEEERVVGQRVTELRTQVADLEAARKNLATAIRELERHVHDRFTTAFRAMDETFNRTFREIFGGGRASLSLVKPKPIEHAFPDLAPEGAEEGPRDLSREAGAKREAPSGAEGGAAGEGHVHELPAGVEIHVHPPGKKLQSLAQLSGGEKALTSIALLFAILEHRASPFVVLDEVDAALDESNSRRFARLLQEAARRTQFIVITHNRATMEAASALYGVTMGDDGVSQLLSIKLEDVTAAAASGQAAHRVGA